MLVEPMLLHETETDRGEYLLRKAKLRVLTDSVVVLVHPQQEVFVQQMAGLNGAAYGRARRLERFDERIRAIAGAREGSASEQLSPGRNTTVTVPIDGEKCHCRTWFRPGHLFECSVAVDIEQHAACSGGEPDVVHVWVNRNEDRAWCRERATHPAQGLRPAAMRLSTSSCLTRSAAIVLIHHVSPLRLTMRLQPRRSSVSSRAPSAASRG